MELLFCGVEKVLGENGTWSCVSSAWRWLSADSLYPSLKELSARLLNGVVFRMNLKKKSEEGSNDTEIIMSNASEMSRRQREAWLCLMADIRVNRPITCRETNSLCGVVFTEIRLVGLRSRREER